MTTEIPEWFGRIHFWPENPVMMREYLKNVQENLLLSEDSLSSEDSQSLPEMGWNLQCLHAPWSST
jgi:hypothetical protein